MSEQKVIFRNGKAYLERKWSEPCLFMADIIKEIPLHEDDDYDRDELKKLISRLLEEKGSYTKSKWCKRQVLKALRDYKNGDMELEDFLKEDIAQKAVEEVEELDSLLSVMNTTLEIEEGILFKDVWAYIENDYEVFNVIFSDSLGRFDLQLYIDAAKLPPKAREQEEVGMEKLQCYWALDVNKDDYSYFSGEFGGWGKHKYELWEDGEIVGTKIDDCAYGVSFSPMADLMDFPFELKEEIELKRIDDFDGKNLNFIDVTPEINTKKNWTPYAMIQAILYEISWMGSPEDSQNELERMTGLIEDIQSGKEKTIPWEDVKKELDEIIKDEDEEQDDD